MVIKRISKRNLNKLLTGAVMCFVAVGVTLLGLGIAEQLRANSNPAVFIFDDSGSEVIIVGLQPQFQNIERIHIPETINAKPVTKIDDGAFNGKFMLTSVILPTGLESIGSNAFADTGLTEIIIPSSVTDIGANAFATAGLVIHAEAAEEHEDWDDDWHGGQAFNFGTITATFIGQNDQSAQIPYPSTGTITLPTAGSIGFTHSAQVFLKDWIPSSGTKTPAGHSFALLANTTFTAEYAHISQVEKTNLAVLIAEIQALGDNAVWVGDPPVLTPRWTEPSWERLMNALDDAIFIYESGNVTASQIEKAYTDLFRARWDTVIGLQPHILINNVPLVSLVETVERMIIRWEDEYTFWTETSWEKMLVALGEAEVIAAITDGTIAQTAVDKAFNNLNKARRSLDPIANFELPPEDIYKENLLELLIEYTGALNRGDYNRDSIIVMTRWYVLRDARRDAEVVLKDGEPEDLDEAFYALLGAYRDLLIPERTREPVGPVSPFIWVGGVLVVLASIGIAFIVDINLARRSIIPKEKD